MNLLTARVVVHTAVITSDDGSAEPSLFIANTLDALMKQIIDDYCDGIQDQAADYKAYVEAESDEGRIVAFFDDSLRFFIVWNVETMEATF